jgi:sulfhydrogenase subunit alpha
LNYPSAIALAGDHPDTVRLGLRLKKLGNSIQEVIGGRAVHPVNALVGGFGKLPSLDQLVALRDGLRQGVRDCQVAVDLVASLPPADFCHSETRFAALLCDGDYGYYAGDRVALTDCGAVRTFAAADYRSLTNEHSVPHSHARHSSFEGRPFMVGALARLLANGEKLGSPLAPAMEKVGLELPSDNPMDNNKAQALELVFDVSRALAVVERLLADGLHREECIPVRPRAGAGTAVTEAPRGLLIHSDTYDAQGRLTAADVITPTALNASSIEDHLRRTAEQNAGEDDVPLSRKLQMVIRAYDPCISCSVHVLRKRHAP